MSPARSGRLAILLISAVWMWPSPRLAAIPASQTAYLLLDVASGRVLGQSHPEIIARPVLPGSVVKIATLVAALESGTIDESTKILCLREVTVDGRRYTCSHPDLHRPLIASEALGYSCNVFFAIVAQRLPKNAFLEAARSLGLTPPSAISSLVPAALGLQGITATPRSLLDMVIRVSADPPVVSMRDTTRRVVLDGLLGCATYGSGAALGRGGVDALAKTGTAPMAAGGYQGTVVAVSPSTKPVLGVVVLAAGAGGRDAAEIAAKLLTDARRPPAGDPTPASSASKRTITAPATIRVGFARVGGGYDVDTLSLEDYVARVVAGEAAAGSTAAALEVVSITARTFALANLKRHRADGFDVCDLTHCQVVRAATKLTRASAASTAGEVLLFKGVPASVYYSASCGGQTELSSAVWPGAPDPPFLPSRPDPAHAAETPWTVEISQPAIAAALRTARLGRGSPRNLMIVQRTTSGRVAMIRLEGVQPEMISGQNFRMAIGRTLGWNLLKSTAFGVERISGGFRFTGRGSGHGVGLCVIGATRLAAGGATSTAILDGYFPGATIGRISGSALALSKAPAVAAPRRPTVVTPPPSLIAIVLPAADEVEREAIQTAATDFLDTLLKRTSLTRPARVTLRFHPTVESFRRATGQPWWVAAASSGAEIQLLPASVLRSRGTLESTLRHEIAHAITSPRLEGRSRWVAEGAAIYFSGEPFIVPPLRVKCPEDQEIALASSAGALRDAYGRAAACFVQQVDSGRRWDEVR